MWWFRNIFAVSILLMAGFASKHPIGILSSTIFLLFVFIVLLESNELGNRKIEDWYHTKKKNYRKWAMDGPSARATLTGIAEVLAMLLGWTLLAASIVGLFYSFTLLP